MTRLTLVRHGETDWNRDHRMQGRSDVPLNDTGRAQAARTGGLLRRRRWDAVVASPLSRALETGSIIADELGLPAPTTHPDLVERDYGAGEGLEWDELRRRYPDPDAVPGRESREAVAARVVPALQAIAAQHPDASIVVVVHGGVIRAVLDEVAPDAQPEAITNGSAHSFVATDGTLSLIAVDDPLDEQTEQGESLAAQNPVERA